jgi:hypothetical protein
VLYKIRTGTVCSAAAHGRAPAVKQTNKVGRRLWFTIDGTKRQGKLLLLDDLSVVIKENGQARVVTLPKKSEGVRWGFVRSG